MFDVVLQRGCGFRTPGGVYLVADMVLAGGCPVEHFLLHPPRPLNPGELGLAARGEQVLDWGQDLLILQQVGEVFYPTVADYLEEVRLLGLSRKVNDGSFPWEKARGRRLFVGLVHPRGYWDPTPEEWRRVLSLSPATVDDPDAWEQGLTCPRTRPREPLFHPECRVGWETCDLEPRSGRPGGFCPRLYWTDFDEDDLQDLTPQGRGTRHFVSVAYTAFALGRRREVRPALFAVFPVHRIEVVRDREGEAEEKARRIARAMNVPVREDKTEGGLVVTLTDA